MERPTRRRGEDEPSVLDLIFTNEAMQVSEVVHSPPLGKSDHDVLTFEFQCYVDYSKSKERYMFQKGKYAEMREHLSNSNWIDEYIKMSNEPGMKPETMWGTLKSKLLELRNKYVPLGNSNSKPTWKSKSSIPIDEKTRNAIKDKERSHRSWIKSKKDGKSSSLELRQQFVKARNKVNTLLRKGKRKLEREIV